jgi:hypothetical protein
VDDTTFLTKAAMSVSSTAFAASTTRVVPRAAPDARHRFEAALRLLDEHCRVYQYLLKRTIAPIVSAPCPQPIAHEAIQAARRT